jgi:hypothetical protein
VVRGSRYTKALHFVRQSSPRQSKPGGRAPRPPEPSVGTLTRNKNFLANLVLKRWISNFGWGWFPSFRPLRIEYAIATCIATLLDRLLHHAEVTRLEGESYRIRESQREASARRKKP